MMKKTLKWIGNVIITLFLIIVIFSLISVIQSRRSPDKVPTIGNYKFLSVLTGSMRPVLEPGDMIVIKKVKAEDIKKGDIITFKAHNTLVTHRVTEIMPGDSDISFKTKGDANNIEDDGLVQAGNIIGIFKFNIPKGGYASNFARSTAGFILLIVIPAILLIILELKSVLSGLGKGNQA